jgi:hypothetical protein
MFRPCKPGQNVLCADREYHIQGFWPASNLLGDRRQRSGSPMRTAETVLLTVRS